MKEVRLFETGRVFLKEPDPDDYRIPHQPLKLGFVFVGQNHDVFSGTGVVELLSASTRRAMTVRQSTLPAMHPGRAAEVILDSEVVGFVGELHPSVARDVGLEGRVVVGEMDLDPLVATQDDWRLADVSVFPPHVFDLAFAIADDVPADRATEVIRQAAGQSLEALTLFDEYRGASVAGGQRSLAFRLTLRAMDRTLSDEDVAPIRQDIIAAMMSNIGGTLRGQE